MTTTIRAKAKLLNIETQEFLADGIAVIWGDPDDWGGIFEVTDAADALESAIANQPLKADLHTLDGRKRPITITSSEFDADHAHPLKFEGDGNIDTAEYHAFSTIDGRMGMVDKGEGGG